MGPSRLSQLPDWRQFVTRKNRINLALGLISIGIISDLIVLFSDDASAGWTLAGVILLGIACVALLVERRSA
jgi:hypothetical protein